jgi:hypothetical protein
MRNSTPNILAKVSTQIILSSAYFIFKPFVGYLFGGGPLGNNPIIAGQPIPALPPHFQQARNQNEHYQNHQAAIQMPPVADMEQVMQV